MRISKRLVLVLCCRLLPLLALLDPKKKNPRLSTISDHAITKPRATLPTPGSVDYTERRQMCRLRPPSHNQRRARDSSQTTEGRKAPTLLRSPQQSRARRATTLSSLHRRGDVHPRPEPRPAHEIPPRRLWPSPSPSRLLYSRLFTSASLNTATNGPKRPRL